MSNKKLPLKYFPVYILFCLALNCSAQQRVYCRANELQHNYSSGIVTVKATEKLFTGYEFELFYNSTDTENLSYIYNGRIEWNEWYIKPGQLLKRTVNYNHGFKQDSICSEAWQLSQPSGDTTNYFYSWVDKNKVKWTRQVIHMKGGGGAGYGGDWTITARFLARSDIRKVNRRAARKKENFDSLGYSSTPISDGLQTTYYPNGRIANQGRNGSYDYYLNHKGGHPPYPSSGMVGVWSYYDTTGRLTAENIYDNDAGFQLESRGYYPDGSYHVHTWFRILFADVRLPSPEKIPMLPTDTCYRVEAKWSPDGKLQEVTIEAQKWTTVRYQYYENGNPASFLVTRGDYGFNPIGIRREWDEQGRTKLFINYSDNTNDTLCYQAKNGHITELNLMSKDSLGKWKGVGGMYSEYINAALRKQSSVYYAYDDNGKLKLEVHLKDGLKHGAYIEYFSSGTIAVQGNFTNGAADGEWKEWYESGQLKYDNHYLNGIRNGSCEEYYPDGKLKWKNTYANGQCGKGEAYRENGSRINADSYVEAFADSNCIAEYVNVLRTTALHDLLSDTINRSADITIRQENLYKYSLKDVALMALLDSGFNYCTVPDSLRNIDVSGMYRSVFAITPNIYDKSGRANVAAFFKRHGIRIDSTIAGVEPVMGDTAWLVYYSSSEMLNKKLIADSLEAIFFSKPGSWNEGRIVSMDSYVPESFAIDKNWELVSHPGYITVMLQPGPFSGYPYEFAPVSYYVIYDDLTADPVYVHEGSDRNKYWALSNY